MNEMEERIGPNYLLGNYKDGQVYLHTNINELESVVKQAINDNFYDIQRLHYGYLTTGNALKLNEATLSKQLEEGLQDNDAKVPTSRQVKVYVDNSQQAAASDYLVMTNKPKLNGIEMSGEKTSADYGIKQSYTASDIVFTDGQTLQYKFDNGLL